MRFLQIFAPALSLCLADAYLVSPPGTAAPGAADECSAWVQSSYGLTCDIIRRFYGMSQQQFEKWNPSVGAGCNLIDGLYYCVQVNYITQSPTWTPPPTSTSTTSTSTSVGVVSTPTPTQADMVGNCNDFYLVVAGDTCFDIAAAHDIALNDLYNWNPALGTSCGGLWAGYYICVGTATTDMTTRTTTTATTTTAGSSISTPTPTQAGMTSNCDEFHFVVSGDGCFDIAAAAGISLDDFYSWNPAVGNDCSSLWADYYVCVGITGPSPTSTTTTRTTTAGNGVATPTPTQAGMVASCNEFYLVVSGDGCWAIANQAGISLENFYAWNPAVGDTCGKLWPDYYVCIGVL